MSKQFYVRLYEEKDTYYFRIINKALVFECHALLQPAFSRNCFVFSVCYMIGSLYSDGG